MSEYKIKQLVDNGYDFNAVFPDKQKLVRDTTEMDFTLGEIVEFLKRETNNFTKKNQIAIDLDEAIFKLVSEYEEEKTAKEAPAEPTAVPTPSEPTKPSKEILQARLKLVGKMLDKKPDNAVLKGRAKIIEKMLSKMEDGGIMAEGGMISNNYEGKQVEQVWNEWTPKQRLHFLNDHVSGWIKRDTRESISKMNWKEFHNVDDNTFNSIARQLESHILFEGQYSSGGSIGKGGKKWIINAVLKDGRILSQTFDKSITHKEIFNKLKKDGYVVTDSQIFEVENYDVIQVIRKIANEYAIEKFGEELDSDNTLVSYQIVENRIIIETIAAKTKSGKDVTIKLTNLFDSIEMQKGGKVCSLK
jgi:hypothetical protein